MTDLKILDCTLRDGGYYTNWDFDEQTVLTYLNSLNKLPIDYLEIGYRSPPLKSYHGEFFYCPTKTLEFIKEHSHKKLAIILNEKDISVENIHSLLEPCIDIIDMIRIAIDPINFSRALLLARVIKNLGFEVAFNVMYMSKWSKYKEMMENLGLLDGLVDYLYLVDSYGGVVPDEVKSTIQEVKSRTSVKLGFHGHNNLELALANTLAAIEEGVDIVDSTVTGMGRGAGNLKTELLLTLLDSKNGIEIDFNSLSQVTTKFSILQSKYKWGTSMPYMVSGANSLPQKQVMEWVNQKTFTFNTIIQALKNQINGLLDNKSQIPLYVNSKTTISNCVIVGGGPSVKRHRGAIKTLISKLPDTVVIHSSAKNSRIFADLDEEQIYCLAGNEGFRIESLFQKRKFQDKAVLPPYPREMGTYIPEIIKDRTFELDSMGLFEGYKNSHTAIALRVAEILNCQNVWAVGYDGYSDDNIGDNEINLFNENEKLFSIWNSHENREITALTNSKYTQVKQGSLYAF